MNTIKIHELLRSVFTNDLGNFLSTDIKYREDWQISEISDPCVVCHIALSSSAPSRNNTVEASIDFVLMLNYEDISDDEAKTIAGVFFETLQTNTPVEKGGFDVFAYSFDWQRTDSPSIDSDTNTRIFQTNYKMIVQF